MNFINCSNNISPELFRKTVVFWSENSYQHIASLLKSPRGTTAIFQNVFKEQLEDCYNKFKEINSMYKTDNPRLPIKPDKLFAVNNSFIHLLERIKFEAFSGYPILQQSVFHYIYEQRYINAVFAMKNPIGFVLITEYFKPFDGKWLGCVYNQMYFWGIIGAMHPSLLMDTNAFYNAINGYSKEFLTSITNGFNKINFLLSQLKKPVKKQEMKEVFTHFKNLNSSMLEFLLLAKSNSPRVYSSPQTLKLSEDFYGKVQHMINEHTLVKEINANIEKMLP